MTVIPMLGTIVTIVFAIILILFVVLNVLKGLSKGLVPMAINTVFIVISGLLSVVVSVPLGKLVSKALAARIDSFTEGFIPGYGELASASSGIESLMSGISAVTVSILLYFVIFALLLALMLIPTHFIRKKLIDKFFPELPKVKWAGALCGLVTGLALFVFVCAPITGTLAMIGDASSVAFGILSDGGNDSGGEAFDDRENEVILLSSKKQTTSVAADDKVDVYNDVISPVTDNFFVKFTSAVGGKAIFNSLTVFEVDGKKVSVSKEVSVVADVFSALMPVLDGDAPSQWTKDDIKGIRSAAEKLSESELVSDILADVLSSAAEKWDKDESFLGIKMPEAEKSSVNNFLKEFFVSFKATTKDTVDEDLSTMADVLGQLQSHGMLKSHGDDSSDAMKEEGFLSGLLEIIMKNERFKGSVATVINIGVHESLDVSDVPSRDSEEYISFVNDVTLLINEVNAEEASISEAQEKMQSLFISHNISAEKDITDHITTYLMLEFSGRTDVGYDEVDEFFAVAFDAEKEVE